MDLERGPWPISYHLDQAERLTFHSHKCFQWALDDRWHLLLLLNVCRRFSNMSKLFWTKLDGFFYRSPMDVGKCHHFTIGLLGYDYLKITTYKFITTFLCCTTLAEHIFFKFFIKFLVLFRLSIVFKFVRIIIHNNLNTYLKSVGIIIDEIHGNASIYMIKHCNSDLMRVDNPFLSYLSTENMTIHR